MTVTTVLFDYSGVLTTGLQLPSGDLPFDAEALMHEMVAALATLDPHPWHDLERGEISLDEYVDYVEAKVPGAGVLFAAGSVDNVMANLELLEDRVAVAAELKDSGVRVGLVTNNVAEWQPYWLPRLPPDLFEVVIDSAAVGMRKPEAAIYELAMERMSVSDPQTVLFIDDFEWNVDGAKSVGMAGLHCTADLDLRAAVAEYLRV